MNKAKWLILSGLSSAFFLQGCAPIIIGGAATTASIAHDRRTAGVVIDDNAVELKIKSAISSTPGLNDNSHINVTGYNGNVLLTGEAANQQIIAQIDQLAKNQPQVKQVYNQIIVGRASSFSERTYDAKQTAKVKAALFDVPVQSFDPTRIKVVTEHGITYLLGLVSAQEGESAAAVASRVSGVKKVVTLFENP